MFKLKILTILTVALTFALSVSAYALTLEDANKVFNDYDKDITNIQKSIDMYNQIILENDAPQIQYKAYNMLSKAYLTLGDQSKLTHTNTLKDYQAGEAAAKKAIALNPKGAQGYFWCAANIGRISQYKGVINSLFMLPDFKKYLGKAYALDKNNYNVLEAYGEMYYELPWIAGGSDSKALDYLNRSLKVDPNFTLSMAIMGKVYIKDDKYDQAREILNKVLTFTTPTFRADWAMFDKPLAQKLLDSIKNKK